ncbi:MAG: hypothetical protein ACRC9S_08220 [Vibrio sp.]
MIAFTVFAFWLNRTVYERNTLAIGGNEEAARLTGVILEARMTSGQPMTSFGLELVVISTGCDT